MRIDLRRLLAASALTLVATTGSAAAQSFEPAAPAAPGAQERVIHKAPGSTLQVRWTAAVREQGEFVLGRIGPRGFEPLVRLPADPRLASYQAELVAGSESALHELRFRDRSGREIALQSVLISRPSAPSFGEIATPMVHRSPTLGAALLLVLPFPTLETHGFDIEAGSPSGSRPEPSTPPPERSSQS